MHDTPQDLSTVVTVVSITVGVVTTVINHAVSWIIKGLKAKHDAEIHKQEMTIRIRVSDEYEKLIEQLGIEVKSLKEQNKDQAQQIETLEAKLEEAEKKHRACEEKNLQAQQWVAQLESRLAQLEQRQ